MIIVDPVEMATSTRSHRLQSLIDSGAVMPASLRDMQTLRSILGRLNAEQRARRLPAREDGSARTLYQEREGDFRRRLLLAVESRKGRARVLVTGQIGVGKSSEVWDFGEECYRRGDLGFPVFCDLEYGESPERSGATGLFLTILRDCWAATKDYPGVQGGRSELDKIRDEIWTRLFDWLHGAYTDDGSKAVFAFSGMDFPIPLDNRSRAHVEAVRSSYQSRSERADERRPSVWLEGGNRDSPSFST